MNITESQRDDGTGARGSSPETTQNQQATGGPGGLDDPSIDRGDDYHRRQVETCSGRLEVWQWRAGRRPPGVGPIELVSTKPFFGGLRWWFACPRCGGRVGVLWQPDAGDPWLCRGCHELTYKSCQEAHENESLGVGLARIQRHFAANGGGWGDVEWLFDGLSFPEKTGVWRAMAWIDRQELETRKADHAAKKRALRLKGRDVLDLSR